jgi:EAL domain-containing protein (putative c-di-GMP-specific phosphodiesterase class I)
MSDPDTALKALSMLDRMGIALSIDDFGTGYSSMAQLKKMPVSELKIDKAFVLRLAHDDNDKTIVRTLIAMANSFSLATVAEGVEDEETLALLAQMSCTKAQGFGICRPLPADEITQWLTSRLRSDS